MHDRQLEMSSTKCGAITLGLLALLCVGGNHMLGHFLGLHYNRHVADCGLLFGMASSVLWVRCYFVRQAAMFKDAFELGRVAGHRDQSDDRPMRSVR